MKMVVGYIEHGRFDAIRAELLEMGFLSISAWDAIGTIPEPAVAGVYRGATVENHVRPKTRLECVAGDDEVSIVVDTVLKHAGERVFVFVVAVEEAFPTTTVKATADAPAGG